MHFVVNGVPFFAKGANWIPADCFANRMTKEILRRFVHDAVAANMNCLRFWGGGYYEDDELYDLCDETGPLRVAGLQVRLHHLSGLRPGLSGQRDAGGPGQHPPPAAPPVDRRLVWQQRDHVLPRQDEWTTDKMSAADYYRLFRDTLGDAVGDYAPRPDFVTGSPDCGDVHFWEVWHGGKPFEVYRDIHGFVSEFGFQSFPEPKTVAAFTAPEDRAHGLFAR